jgi:PAS domain S-box-containing protein
MPAVIVRSSADGAVEYVSPQVEEQFHRTPAEFIKLLNSPNWLDLVHPDDRERVAGFYAGEWPTGARSSEIEMRALMAEGGYRTLLVRRAKLPDSEGGAYFQTVIVDVTDLRAAEGRSRDALAALVRAGEEAQSRLAVELHDDTVQVLTAVLLQLQRSWNGNAAVTDAAYKLEGAIERTRRLMFELRPEVLERHGLAAAMAILTDDGPWGDVDIDIHVSRQSETVEALCYRTLRELVVNARKHSNAHSLSLFGRESEGRLDLRVADDGDGFEPSLALSGDDNLHIGLRTVVERVRMAGGDVVVSSRRGAGTAVQVHLPADPRRHAPAPAITS